HDKRRKDIEFQEGDHVFLRVISTTEVGRALKNYVADPSHVIKADDVQGRDNLTVETIPLRIEGREVKKLRNKEIASMKVVWGGPAGENATWELERKMKDSYPELFS
ncbi:putative retrotransposon gag protein, partial [Trifolium medium]|nr:putative retrotransposon gag protein [Trifolium medium]